MNSPLFRDLKFPMNLTYSYAGGSLGLMVPRSMWQQNSSWFLAAKPDTPVIHTQVYLDSGSTLVYLD